MKRSSYLEFIQGIDLNKAGLKIWGFDPNGKFVARLEINAAGLKVFTGERGGKKIAYVNWEGLVEKLQA